MSDETSRKMPIVYVTDRVGEIWVYGNAEPLDPGRIWVAGVLRAVNECDWTPDRDLAIIRYEARILAEIKDLENRIKKLQIAYKSPNFI